MKEDPAGVGGEEGREGEGGGGREGEGGGLRDVEEGIIALTIYSLTQNDQCIKYFLLSSFKFDCHVEDDHIN